MEPVDKPKKLNQAPPVPIKTYQWEDKRRERKRGKYPYTHLTKGPTTYNYEMEDNGEKKEPVKKKIRKVKKIKKMSGTPEPEKDIEKSTTSKKDDTDVLMQVEQIVTEETEITEIKLKEEPIQESIPLPSPEPEVEKLNTENLLRCSADESEEIVKDNINSENAGNTTLSTEETEVQEISTKSYKENMESIQKTTDNENKTEESGEQENVNKLLTDTSSKNEKSITESEDTYTDSNIEQYLDKDVSKSISDASCLEATSTSDIELHDETKRQMLQNPPEKKRKHSNISEIEKSNLFETLKKTKLKSPTFKIPKFKKPIFFKKSSRQPKIENVQNIPEKVETETKKTKKSESPVYIHIPLNPTREELELERQNQLRQESNTRSVDSINGNNRTNELNGTNNAAIATNTSPDKVKRKLGAKTDKKSPPIKKKDKKKTSPKSENKMSPLKTQKRRDSPVEYIHIPLTGPLPLNLQQTNISPTNNINIPDDTVTSNVEHSTETLETPATIKGSHTGAIKKEPTKKIKAEYKLAKDIKKLASKLKNIQRKNKKVLSNKKLTDEQILKKKQIAEKKRGDSPVEYIHIPLKGPLPEEYLKTISAAEVDEHGTEAEENLSHNKEDSVTTSSTEETSGAKEKLEKNKSNDLIEDNQIKEEIDKQLNIKETQDVHDNEITPSAKISKNIEETEGIIPKREAELNKEEEITDTAEKTIETKKTSTELVEPSEPSTELVEPSETSTVPVETKETSTIPATSGRSVESILRMTGSSLSLENQKFVKIEKVEKKESLLKRMKSINKSEKKNPLPKKEPNKIPDKENIKTPKTDSFVTYPGVRHKDSIVEYIHIPLKSSEGELNQYNEQENVEELKNIETSSHTINEIQKELIPDKQMLEIKKTETEPVNSEELTIQKTQEDSKLFNDEQKKPEILSTKEDSKPDKGKQLKDKKQKSSMPPVAIRREDSIVEYIHIPLNPTEEEFAKEKLESEQKGESKTLADILPETKIKPIDSATETKTISKGAISKQPQEKTDTKQKPSSKFSTNIKKFAMKLKKMQKPPKKPTFKTFKRNSKLGKKKHSPPSTKKAQSNPLIMRPRREDSPVEYIFIPLNPTPEQLRLEQEREKLRQKARKPATDEIQKEKTKQKLRKLSKTPTTIVTKKPKLETSKKPETKSKSTFHVASSFDSLKKTKELGKNKLKEIKENVQHQKNKIINIKNPKTEKKVQSSNNKNIDITKKDPDSPDYIFIPLNPLEISQPSDLKLNEEVKDNIELKMHEKVIPDKLNEDEVHIYEPISKEDEEDGLKSALHVYNTEDPSKTEKQISLEKKPASIGKEQGKPEHEEQEDQVSKQVDEQPDSKDQNINQEEWLKLSDHEYEPINPPREPETEAAKASTSIEETPSDVHRTDLTDLTDELHTLPNQEARTLELRQLRIPLDDELVVANAETSELEPAVERISLPETQGSQGTQLGTSTTTSISRTDEITTSQVDSAILEHLRAKDVSGKKEVINMEETEPRAPSIQEKLRTHAGKLKNKISNIKKPTFTIPNPKFSPKFKRPKFNRPKISRPKFQTPKFQAPKFERPKFSIPKMPERPKINFPSFNIPRPGSSRQQPTGNQPISTTESSADSRNIFDFRTYPRLFDRSKKKSNVESNTESIIISEPATVPRAAARKKGPVGARWVHRFTDIQFVDEDLKKPASYSDELHSKDRGDSLERRMEADLRYEQALAEADDEMTEYVKENRNISRHSPYHVDNMEYPERWRHGSFHRSEEFKNMTTEEESNRNQPLEYDAQQSNRDEHSSVASSGHQGVIEEIDSDQFFLREKGISQDNLQVGLYLSSEIRDAFRKPVNTLSQMEAEYNGNNLNSALPHPRRPKRKHLKKTKRMKKTPHASEEKIPFDQASINTEPEDQHISPMTRPRRTKRSKILVKEDSLQTSQSEITVDDDTNLNSENLKSQENLTSEISNDSIGNIIGYVEKDIDVDQEYNNYLEESLMYENEIMKNIERPEIIINADQNYEIERKEIDKFLEYTGMVETPKPPTRRHKSLKSLNISDHDSILGEFNKDKIMEDILQQELNVYKTEHDYVTPHEDEPVAPRRTRSRSRSQVDDGRSSRGAESFITEPEEICEPPCVQDMRDTMGYAIIDKSQKYRGSPLPPTHRRRKFFTTAHPIRDTPPVRPTRNYSTLGPNKPTRRKPDLNVTDIEEKENIDISQYIEIEDEDQSKDLQSGEIINKMKSRPLPAPPRPPRKGRDRSKEALRDITLQSNVQGDISDYEKTLNISPTSPTEVVEEIEVSTQTDPLPDDFCCDMYEEEPTDRIIAPTRRKRSIQDSSIHSFERPKTPLERDSFIHESLRSAQERASSPIAVVIERKLQTPVEDETVTHASLLVRPVPEYPPESFVNKRFGTDPFPESIHPLSEHEKMHLETNTESVDNSFILSNEEEQILKPILKFDESETSSVPVTPLDIGKYEQEITQQPEKPQRRKSQVQMTQPSQPQIIERIIERQVPVCVTPGPDTEVEVLRAQRLQVSELDVEKLNVSELQANKILVSEIDGVSLQISELTSKSGNLTINGLEISSGLIQEILDRLQSTPQTSQQPSPSTEQVATQTETSIEELKSNNKEFTELISEQITSATTASNQVNIDENNENIIYYSTQQDQLAENIDSEEFEELNILPIIHAEQLEHKDNISPNELVRLSSPSPTIIIDPPESSTEQEQPEPDQIEEQDAIAQIRERIRFIEEEMSEFICDFTPNEMDEIKSEIESIIDMASEHVSSKENIAETRDKLSDFQYNVDNIEIETENTEQVTEKSLESCSPNIQDEILSNINFNIEPILTPLLTQSENNDTSEAQEPELHVNTDTPNSQHITSHAQSNIQTKEAVTSFVPKEFHILKSEQAQIIDNIQKQMNIETKSLQIKKSEEDINNLEKTNKTENCQQIQPKSIEPKTLHRPPSPSQEPVLFQLPPGQSIIHEIQYPLSYYPEYVASIPPASFYTMSHQQNEDRSDEEVPIHHRRRKHHRHLSRSRSSSDERHASSRRLGARALEPSIPQLTGQLAQAYSTVIARLLRQLASYLGSCLDTRDGKQNLQIAMVILLVLIAGLILLGFGSEKTVHLHHWEYFNPPKEL